MTLCWADMAWWWRSPDCVAFKIGVWFITLLLGFLLVVFLCLEGAWSDTFDFCFHWLLIYCPKWTTWRPGTSVAPPIPWGTQARSLGESSVFSVLHSAGFLCLGVLLLKACSARPPRGVCITGVLGDLRCYASPPRAHLLGASLGIPAPQGVSLHREISRVSLTAWFRPPWFLQGVYRHPLCSIAARGTACPSPGARWNRQDWSLIRSPPRRWSVWRRRSAVLSNSCPSSRRRTAVAGPVVTQHRRRRRDKVLVLAMTDNHKYHPLLLTCCVVFDQIALRTSKSLVVVVTYISEWK